MKDPIRSLEFKENKLFLIDQRFLPGKFETFVCSNFREAEFAIAKMVIRGAPAIGVTAAYGVVLAALEFMEFPRHKFFSELQKACYILSKSRPTAVNLTWSITRMQSLIDQDSEPKQIFERLKFEADKISAEDVMTNKLIGKIGNSIVPQKSNILTHCNTGSLATVEYGTALGVVRSAFASGKAIHVFVDETRPRLQGAKLTAWELAQEGIPATLIADNAAASLIKNNRIDLILVGADRIATNGDSANKIGTFMLSEIAKSYNTPFYIVAPTSTFDFNLGSGNSIEIEERDPTEITHINGMQIAPNDFNVYNPAFDITPASNITAIITEKGIIKPPFIKNIK
ncbi:MAG: S-methyl-5-thioribose-1-phosphate isomerase [Candidatus Cloacimonetes bacterium]|nr:S-methyl-5-thioribose-1-phosphate isomerase [Candidatus Cloacimonadota bacterium]